MKNKKRLVTVALSAVLAAASAVQTVASASDIYINKNKDPNGAGGLTIGDSVYISQYLSGLFSPTDLDQLDMNDNCIVNSVDATLIQLYDAGVISSISYNECSKLFCSNFSQQTVYCLQCPNRFE